MNTNPIHDSIGTLDVLVAAVLNFLGLRPLAWRDSVLSVDAVCEHNARVFLTHFEGRPIQAIKELREVSALTLADAKAAYEQIRDSYTSPEMFANQARAALDAGSYLQAATYAQRAAEAR